MTRSYFTWLIDKIFFFFFFNQVRLTCITIGYNSYVTWLIDMCDMTHSHVTWLIHRIIFFSIRCGLRVSILDTIHMWHDSVICVTWLVHMSHDWFIGLFFFPFFNQVRFTCIAIGYNLYVTWLIEMCNITHSYFTWLIHRIFFFSFSIRCGWRASLLDTIHTWHDSLICVIWLIHGIFFFNQVRFTCIAIGYNSYVTWLTDVCDMTHAHDAFSCHMTHS